MTCSQIMMINNFKFRLDKNIPSHEQLFFALILTFVGGFFDAYTFINSNGIFANAQTGNLIFIGLDLSKGNFSALNIYLPPVLFFILGVVFNQHVVHKYKNLSIIKFLNISLLIQIVLLIFIVIVPSIYLVDIRPLIISFICAMQYDSYRTVNNLQFASIFSTGNLRSASEYMYKYLFKKEEVSKKKFYIYACLLLFFIAGVLIGAVTSNLYGHYSILVVIMLLVLNLWLSYQYEKSR